MKLEQIHIFVSGHVQGVGFRYATRGEARRLGLSGWVRNTRDLRVEIEAQGESTQIDSLLDWCRQGPAGAHVTDVQVIERKALEESAAQPTFEIRH